MPDTDPSAAPANLPAEANDVTIDIDADVATVTLHRPPHNLLTEPALKSLADAIEQLGGRARSAVLCSEGRSFCAGADFSAGDAPDPTDKAAFIALTRTFYSHAARIFASPLPVVAAVQGAVVGAGVGIALACDVRVVGERGWFQTNFVRLGIHPGFALTVSLPRYVGPGLAADLLLTGRRVDAAEAFRIGIAEKVVPQGEELSAALEVARQIAANSPNAVSATRSTLRAGLVEEVRTAMSHEFEEQAELAGTPDAIEGVRAMLERREPHF
jgi:2-(1,2-epoxy-1,2-dihydrophenyl)acetyl-CoA isomerase